ncbi:DUF2087 domain-containing protein [Streptomyces collinus]|uniref:DUF2087 domain-containing protein n=1 Tax=Streptomyces collinus TaxID=42684 RepID=UPI003F541B3B
MTPDTATDIDAYTGTGTGTDANTGTDTDTDSAERARQLIGLLAEESRMRALAAVALGADGTERVAEVAGLSAKDAAVALLRLREQGVVVDGAPDGLAVSYGLFRGLVRRAPPAPRTGGGPDPVLDTFVRDGRLVRLPAQWTRKKLVLRHIAERTFEPGAEYPERVVNERLRAWCEDSDGVDHVTLRRYLVDLHHLHRSEGVYRRPGAGTEHGTGHGTDDAAEAG